MLTLLTFLAQNTLLLNVIMPYLCIYTMLTDAGFYGLTAKAAMVAALSSQL